MHVAVADRAALAYTYQLKIFAHDSGKKDGRFTTEQVKSIVETHSSSKPIIAINGTEFSCSDKKGDDSCYNGKDGAWPSFTVVTDGILTHKGGFEVALTLDGKVADNKIPIKYIDSKSIDKEFENQFNTPLKDQFNEGEDASRVKAYDSPMYWTIGSHQGSRKDNTCPNKGDTGPNPIWGFIPIPKDDPLSLLGYSDDEIIFLVSHHEDTFGNFEDTCEAMRIFGASDAVLMDGGGSEQLVVDGKLKNVDNDSSARHVVNAVGLVYNTPDTTDPYKDGKHRIIHSTKYRCEDNICWSPSWKSNFNNLAPGTLSCWDADKWFTIENGDICGEKTERDRSICAEVYRNSSADGETGDNSTGSGGSYTQPKPDDPPVPGLPDFITDKVTLANESGSKEKYKWKINETLYVHSWTDNIGDANWQGSAERIKVPFYLSKGIHEDSHSEWKRIDRMEIKRDKLKVNQPPKHEYIKFNLQDYANDGTVMPGRTYNFVVCADRPHDEDNGDGDVQEKHKSNNCSTEAIFYVDYGPSRNVDLMADNLALTGGRTSLQAGEKYGLQVEVSNIGTEQPWNGFLTSYEIKGPGTGNVWQRISQDSSQASSLYPGAIHSESMSSDQEVNAPMVGGDYVFRACADYTQAVPETNESNNCTAELSVYVAPPPMPDSSPKGFSSHMAAPA